ncbi:hypothetical protein B296_00036996 [Ensete ventricosum]|uniref:Uncharacterized protein n=1 Tax=Ensete ventricosum TaxID=4639 RepID=A0A426X9P9_ENSVE|nr:hypothetical protein B296_00036996 [Ensete ventricosum]
MSAAVFRAAYGAEVVEKRSNKVLQGRGSMGATGEEDATTRMAGAASYKKGAIGSNEDCVGKAGYWRLLGVPSTRLGSG